MSFFARPARAKTMTARLMIFVQIVTVRLLKRSARLPPSIENKMKGMEKHAPTIRTKRSRSAGARPMPAIRKTTRVLSVFSLKAPWNWVTMSAQKPRGEWCADRDRVSMASIEECDARENLRAYSPMKPETGKVRIEVLWISGLNRPHARRHSGYNG